MEFSFSKTTVDLKAILDNLTRVGMFCSTTPRIVSYGQNYLFHSYAKLQEKLKSLYLAYRISSVYVQSRMTRKTLEYLPFGVLRRSPEGVYEAQFYDELGDVYNIRFKGENKPRTRASCIETEEGKDVMSIILRYAGPNRDFYGIPTTPKDLALPALDFYDLSGDVYQTVGENDALPAF